MDMEGIHFHLLEISRGGGRAGAAGVRARERGNSPPSL